MFNLAFYLDSFSCENQWNYVISNFNPDNIILLGDFEPSSIIIQNAARELPNDGSKIVFMAPLLGRYIQGEIPLQDFVHPVNTTYIFGPDNDNLDTIVADYLVYIPTSTNDELYSWVAAAVTLWDRMHG